MICIPYIVNDTYRVARLGAQQDATPYYIVESNEYEVELFCFEDRFYAFDPNSGMGENGENDFRFEVAEDKCTVANAPATHTSCVRLGIKKRHPEPTDNAKAKTQPVAPCAPRFKLPDGLNVEGAKVKFNLQKIGHKSQFVSTVKVTLFDVDEDGMEYSFGLNVAQTENIWDIVIDFGSEASQVWTNQRPLDSFHGGNQMPLFDNIKRTSKCKGDKDGDIYQYDPSDPKLFRSLFFVKKVVAKNFIEQADLTFINKVNDLVAMLGDNVALPNLKLMDHNQVYLPDFTFNGAVTNIFTKSDDIRGEVLKFFFQKALRQVNQLASKRQLACKLIFLVPNTYMQATLSKVYNQLVKDVDDLFAPAALAGCDGEKAAFDMIKPGIEVATFSESDASFFGCYGATDYHPGQGEPRILIIDVGKGTTDFSVLCVKGGVGSVEVERNARSGFVGAGNVMTFAIFVSAVKLLADELGGHNHADIYDAIKGIAYYIDDAKKNMLYQSLEQLKRNGYMNGRTSLAQFMASYPKAGLSNVKDVSIDKWNDILKEACSHHCYVDDNDPVIQAYAQLMAKRLMSELKYVFDLESDKRMPIHEVIFSGRGSKSLPLENAIKNELKAALGDDVTFSKLTSSIKNGCLKGPLNKSLKLDHMNMPIVGWPLQMKFQPRNDNAPKPKKKENRRRGFFEAVRNFWNEEDSGSSYIPTVSEQEEELRRNLSQTRHVPTMNKDDMSKIQGLPINIVGEGNRFVLGNRRCFVDIRESQQGEKRIFFDGEDFVARDAYASHRFVYEHSNNDESFITETLFPMTGGSAAGIEMAATDEVLKATLGSNLASDDDFAVGGSIGEPTVQAELSETADKAPDDGKTDTVPTFDDNDFAV